MGKTQKEMMEREGWWTMKAAAERIGVSVHTVYRWLRIGEVRGTKVGDRWYVERASLVARIGPVAARACGLSEGQ